MGDAFGAWLILGEAGVLQAVVHGGESGGLHAEVDDNVDVVGRSDVSGVAVDFVDEDHLPADEQPVLAEARAQLEQCSPRLALPTGERRQADGGPVSHRAPRRGPLRRPSGGDRPIP